MKDIDTVAVKIPTNPEWHPMSKPPKELGHYLVKTDGECWLIAQFYEGWFAPGAEDQTLTHWAELETEVTYQ